MEEPPPNKNRFLLLCLLLVGLCFFVSCADDKVNVAFAQANLVFDYSEKEKPAQSLSVFVEVASNVRRVDSISVSCGDYVWNIQNPFLFQSENSAWAGYMNLAAPPNLKKFPKGRYVFECVDAAGNVAQGSFFVDYNDALLDAEFSSDAFAGGGWDETIAVYSEAFELLYFDFPKDDWENDRRIFSSVRNSNFYRRVFRLGAQVCLAPKIYKDGGSGNAL